MKTYKKILLFFSAAFIAGGLLAQDASETKTPKKIKPVKNTFESVWLNTRVVTGFDRGIMAEFVTGNEPETAALLILNSSKSGRNEDHATSGCCHCCMI